MYKSVVAFNEIHWISKNFLEIKRFLVGAS